MKLRLRVNRWGVSSHCKSTSSRFRRNFRLREGSRLATFPSNVPVTLATACAVAGFHYVSGTYPIVSIRCFSCELEFSCYLPRLNPLTEHLKRNCACTFLRSVCDRDAAEVAARRCKPAEEGLDGVPETPRLEAVSREPSFVLGADTFDLARDLETRLITLESWPKDNCVRKEDLAAAGFYFTGSDDVVQCFSCGLNISEWKVGHCPFVEHRRLSPECKYLAGLISGRAFQHVNDSGTPIADPHLDDFLMLEERHRLSTFASFPEEAAAVMPVSALARAGFYYTGYKAVSRCAFCRVTLKNLQRGELARRVHGRLSPFCPLLKGACPERKSMAKMECESVRFDSFADWPKQLPVSVGELAASGFYYSGSGDRVTCFSCLQSVCDWNTDEDVTARHTAAASRCPYLNGEYTANIPLQSVPAAAASLGEDLSRYQDDIAQVKSFRNWPEQVGVETGDLVDAGFFYTGKGDAVTCPFCTVTVRHWSSGHTPLARHKLLSPRCPFVLDAGRVPVAAKQQPVHLDVGVVGSADELLRNGRHSAPPAYSPHDMPRMNGCLHNGDHGDNGYATLPANRCGSTGRSDRSNSCPENTRCCIICLDRDITHIFSPCSHVVCCLECIRGHSLTTCPMCKQGIEKCTRVYLP